MTVNKINYVSVFNKCILYSEALAQYNRLDEADKKIVEPYILHLKEAWQSELKALSVRKYIPVSVRLF